MENPSISETVAITRYRGTERSGDSVCLISETVLTVRINGVTRFTPARTPGHEAALAAGLCVGAGYGISPENIKVSEDSRSVDVFIPDAPAPSPRPPSEIPDPFAFSVLEVPKAVKALNRAQNFRSKTFSTHAAVIFDETFSPLSSAEDVSRHSAIDKAIGMAFLEGTLSRAKAVMLSCRQNSDVVAKIVNAGIPVLLAVSRPTLSALETAGRSGLTLAMLDRNGDVLVFCGGHRILIP